mmetsp:Transcript_60405/g.168787  ORF Transcript_60405/g.168787 Transcript_60405/m.168787 type:complete len:437 (+) Transcript_60405:62-1372(+)
MLAPWIGHAGHGHSQLLALTRPVGTSSQSTFGTRLRPTKEFHTCSGIACTLVAHQLRSLANRRRNPLLLVQGKPPSRFVVSASASQIPLLSLEDETLSGEGMTPILDAVARLGVFQVALPSPLPALSAKAFALSAQFLSQPEDRKRCFGVGVESWSGTWCAAEPNGYHARGELGRRYNKYRSGFVFQGRTVFPLLSVCEGCSTEDGEEFVTIISKWRACVWKVASDILDRLWAELLACGHVTETACPLSPRGSMDMISNSQFHMKQMHSESQFHMGQTRSDNDAEVSDPFVRLPLHQDPSFVSLVLHESSEPLGQGLEVLDDDSRSYVALPHSGVGVATIFVGQLFHVLLGRSALPVAKARHRVATLPKDMGKRRLAATFFFQPRPDAVLRPLVTSARPIEGDEVVTFGQRRDRAYARYFRVEDDVVRSDADRRLP